MSIINQKRKLEKQNVILQNKKHNNDTGSAYVQKAILEHKLANLNKHQNKNPNDKTIKIAITCAKYRIKQLTEQIKAKANK